MQIYHLATLHLRRWPLFHFNRPSKLRMESSRFTLLLLIIIN
jgi:hypothetical protein